MSSDESVFLKSAIYLMQKTPVAEWRRGFLYAEGGMSGDEIVATEDFLYGLQGALYLLAGVRGHQ